MICISEAVQWEHATHYTVLHKIKVLRLIVFCINLSFVVCLHSQGMPPHLLLSFLKVKCKQTAYPFLD